MIVHVSGPSGSGKTTMKNSLGTAARSSPKTVSLVDLDAIGDASAIEILDKMDTTANCNVRKFYAKKRSMTAKLLRQFAHEHPNDIIILFGLENIAIDVDRKYSIRADPAEIHRRVHLRTLEGIVANQKGIAAAIREAHPQAAKLICIHKYEQDFIGWYSPESFKSFYAEERSAGYIVKKYEDIERELLSLIGCAS